VSKLASSKEFLKHLLKKFFSGSSATTCASYNQQLTNKYCGNFLGYQTAAIQNAPVCGKQIDGNIKKA
jgi:hypothetical protein